MSHARTKFSFRDHRDLRRALLVVYIAFVAAALVAWRAFWAPDIVFLALVVLFVILGYGKKFIRDFTPFVALLVTYDAFRGFADSLNHHVHYRTMLDFDRWLGGGTLPTVALQNSLYHGHVAWYDFYFVGLYLLHFVAPLALGSYLWLRRHDHYWQYVTSLVVLSYAGFLTYVLFPAAPPWMAARDHVGPHLLKLSDHVWQAFGLHSFPTLYANINPNEVAAVPSLHVAYPTLVALFVIRVFGRRAWPIIIYPLSVAFGVVYLGEHYIFDILLGAVYAVAAYVVTVRVFSYFQNRRLAPTAPQAAKLASPAQSDAD